MFYRVAFLFLLFIHLFSSEPSPIIGVHDHHLCQRWQDSYVCNILMTKKNKSIRIVLKTPESHFTFTPLLCDGGQWPNFQKLKVFPILAVFQSKHQKLQNNFGLPLDLTFSMNKIENLASQVRQRGIRWQKFGNNCQNKCFSRSKATIYCDREFIYG